MTGSHSRRGGCSDSLSCRAGRRWWRRANVRSAWTRWRCGSVPSIAGEARDRNPEAARDAESKGKPPAKSSASRAPKPRSEREGARPPAPPRSGPGRARLLSVQLHGERHVCVHADHLAAQELRLGMRKMGSPVDLGERAREVAFGDVADEQSVQEPVVRGRLRRDHHAAAEVATVGNDHVVHSPTADLVVDRPRTDVLQLMKTNSVAQR